MLLPLYTNLDNESEHITGNKGEIQQNLTNLNLADTKWIPTDHFQTFGPLKSLMWTYPRAQTPDVLCAWG